MEEQAKKWTSRGTLEGLKFDYRRKEYYEYLDYLKETDLGGVPDLLEHFTAYIGHMSLNRVLTIYEIYKKTLGLAGHIADVGVYKGASSLLFAKLIKIFESESLTMCHGFDWFEGTGALTEADSDLVAVGSYKADYESIKTLVQKQGFDNILKIHKLDLMKDLDAFFKENDHLRFKLVMMDSGVYEVMKAAIPFFWERLNRGGIMIFDQYACQFAPGETLAIHELLPGVKVNTIPNSWMPDAYIVKEV